MKLCYHVIPIVLIAFVGSGSVMLRAIFVTLYVASYRYRYGRPDSYPLSFVVRNMFSQVEGRMVREEES